MDMPPAKSKEKSPLPSQDKQHILQLEHAELSSYLESIGAPRFRANQVWQWLYQKLCLSFDEMSNLSLKLRQNLQEDFSFSLPDIVTKLDSEDGATKLLLKADRGLIETVILRYENRVSVCVSSQIGCRLACSFCQTGKLGIVRSLESWEIIVQVLLAAKIVAAEGRRLSHVVFMGMGEPFDNYKNVISAVNRMIDPECMGMSARQVTVSTSGMVPRIVEFAKDSRAALAVSLHAATDSLRTELMPINKRWDLEKLKQALQTYQSKTGKSITIEYILIHNKNARISDAKALVKFIHGLRCKVNLIPFNDHPGLPYQKPNSDEIRSFQKYLADRSIPAPVRYSKGLNISAACGQLAAKHQQTLHEKPNRESVLIRD